MKSRFPFGTRFLLPGSLFAGLLLFVHSCGGEATDGGGEPSPSGNSGNMSPPSDRSPSPNPMPSPTGPTPQPNPDPMGQPMPPPSDPPPGETMPPGGDPPPGEDPPPVDPPPVDPPPAPPATEPPACENANQALSGLRLVTAASASRPIHLVGHPSEPDIALIAERGGTVRQAKGLSTAMTAVELSEPILRVQTSTGSERGLLSLALHPDDPTRLFVFFNDAEMGNASVVEEWKRNAEGGMATRVKELYRAPHSAGNHQGGNLGFGSDKMLYFSIGDNGGGGQGRSLQLSNNYGKILRVDPANGMAPPGNHMGLIWSYGLRNPWRMSFDRKTGDLYIGDVGAGTEEINFQPAGKAGTNWGWSGGGNGDAAPIVSYPNRAGQNCVIGGYVYRGTKNGCMYGRYFYKDRARAAAQSFLNQNGEASDQRTHSGLSGGGLYSFGEDGAGELYMLFENGRVARIVE